MFDIIQLPGYTLLLSALEAQIAKEGLVFFHGRQKGKELSGTDLGEILNRIVEKLSELMSEGGGENLVKGKLDTLAVEMGVGLEIAPDSWARLVGIAEKVVKERRDEISKELSSEHLAKIIKGPWRDGKDGLSRSTK